jgi:hypothetical protein
MLVQTGSLGEDIMLLRRLLWLLSGCTRSSVQGQPFLLLLLSLLPHLVQRLWLALLRWHFVLWSFTLLLLLFLVQ